MTATLLALAGPRALLVGFLLPAAIVALVAYGVFELVRASSVDGAAAPSMAPAGAPAGAGTAALGILDERFARGEIDAEEYVQRRSLLWPSSPPAPVATDPGEPPTGTAVGGDEATSEQPTAAVELDRATDDREPGDGTPS